MEAIVELKRASTPGDTCAPPLCAMYASIEPVVSLSLRTTPLTCVCRPNLVLSP